MPTNPDPTPSPGVSASFSGGARTAATRVSGGSVNLPAKIQQLQESINEMQELLSEISEALAKKSP